MHGQQTVGHEGREQQLERKTEGKQEGRTYHLASIKETVESNGVLHKKLFSSLYTTECTESLDGK